MHARHDVAPRYIVLHLDRLAGAYLSPADRPVAASDRGLASELLGGFFKLWLICAVSGVVLGRTFSGEEGSWVYLLSLTGLMLPVSILLLRNYAAMGAPYGSSATALIAGGMLILTPACC